MLIIDTHAHLDHLENLESVLDSSSNAGVEIVIAVSEDIKSSKKNLEIRNKISSPKVYVAAGIHPSEARLEDLDEMVSFLEDNVSDLVAVGETGLDFWYKWVRKDDSKKKEQEIIFTRMLELANQFDLPIIIHSRGAWQKCFDIVKSIGIRNAEFHWYSGPVDVLRRILDEGFFVSATPSLAYSPEAREAIEYAPIEQILVETDTPVYYRNRETKEGFSAEPKDVFKTFDLCCEIKKIDKVKALEVLNGNAKKFFRI